MVGCMTDWQSKIDLRDPVLNYDEVRTMAKTLIQYHHSLADNPPKQQAFEAAVSYALGGSFRGDKLISTFIKPNEMPRLSRVQAQLYLIDLSIARWCAANNEPADGPASFTSDVHTLCTAIDNTLQISAMPLSATISR